ncbi:hypothetical protein BVRB_9g222950 isoform A [Beta vulgaris subsp. vulgaris]|uniref:synaptonemal complex protein 1 isoform X1 n=1 Tax=Beta vulgaris subsp. vulgaris TaxID=3555 RepID=UPI00053F7211|nr:synaptonemal complex protein 1 isoform X1 [Beta vulgaris subsp. vulgaris]KMT01033.1 hypothetical protein BVRB_9g222950 isoform A [Beta vulgaris subsp. vulgaris]
MDESSSDKESLYARIQELEHERDELHKDIEQLCMQQAGPSYIAFANQMYCRRTAGLEQEVENLKKKLADCIKENSNIKDELSEAKRIKTYMDQLHKSEVTKNTEITKQLEYLRGVITNAFTDRDHAILEAEKAKENEDFMSQKMNDAEKRLQELAVGSAEIQEQLLSLKMKLVKQDQEIENFRKIINKFYKIRQQACRGDGDEESGGDDQCENVSWDEKFACLYNDIPESWSFNVQNEASTANYVAALQEEVESLRSDLQNKMQMGWEIEKHLKSRVADLEHKRILSGRRVIEEISSIRECHSQQKTYITKLLEDEKSYLESVVSNIQEKVAMLPKDVHSEVTDSTVPNVSRMLDSAEALSQALQEKVSALLLLSQQEERHLFEKNVQAALQETSDDLQRTLQLATQEKVNALLELAEVKRQYQLLLEKTSEEGNLIPSPGEKRIVALGRDGRFKNLLKKTSLKHWLGSEGNPPALAHPKLESAGSLNRGCNHSMNDARLRIEIATLKESMQNLERLTYDIRKLRVSLIQVKHTRSSKGASSSTTKVLDEIIREAEMVKTALSAALPLSWSGEGDVASSSDNIFEENSNHGDSYNEKIDSVSAAGIEMVELLILAAQIMKEKKIRREHRLQ